MLHFRPERNRRYSSISYVKAISREPTPPTFDELRHAYHLAGQSFVGKLKEIFLVLDDDQAKKVSNAGGHAKNAKANKNVKEGQKSGQKTKLRASNDNSSEVKKKVPATQWLSCFYLGSSIKRSILIRFLFKR